MKRTIDARLTEIVHELQDGAISLEVAVQAFDDKYVQVAMLECEGNVTRAAQRIDVHRNTLSNRLRVNPALRVRPIRYKHGRTLKGRS